MAIGSTVAVLASPLAIGSASAATGTVSIQPASANQNKPVSSTATVTADVTPSSATVLYTVTSGPDATSPNLKGLACTAPPAATVNCAIHNGGTSGIDTVVVFEDIDSDGTFSGGDISATTTVTFSGAPASINITPVRLPSSHNVTTEADTCEVYKVSAFDASQLPSGDQDILLKVVENTASNPSSNMFTFYDVNASHHCTVPGGGPIFTDLPNPNHEETAFGFGHTGNNGSFEIGLVTTTAGSGSLEACNTGGCVSATVFDTDQVTWGPGGRDAIASLQVTPTSADGYAGTTATYTVTALDAAGSPVGNVLGSIDEQETSGPGTVAPTSCTNTTDFTTGQVTCTITSNSQGTVNETIFANNGSASCNHTGGPDSCEPQTLVTATFRAFPTFNSHALTCVQQLVAGGHQGQGVSSCTLPTSQKSVAFSETLKNNGVPVPGAIVTFTATGTLNGSPATNTTDVTTDANGVATYTVNNVAPRAGDSIAVSTKIGATSLDSSNASWATPAATALDLVPSPQSVTKGGLVAVKATVVDQFGAGFPTSTALTYIVAGRNNGQNGVVSTGSDGSATISYTDTGVNPGSPTDTITVTGPGLSGSASVLFINGSTTASTVVLDTSGNGTSDGVCNASGHTAATNVALTHETEVCAVVKNNFTTPEALAGKTVVFTVSSGQVGAHNGLSSASTATYTATTDINGVAFADVTSTKSGAQTVTATADTASASGTVTYATPTPAAARNIAAAPASGTVTAGTPQKFTFTVTDQYGNGVPGVSVLATQSGPGILANGNSTVITDSNGQASVQLTTQATDTGSGTVTGSIAAGGNQCALAAGNPAGATAGNCTAVATYTIGAPVVPASLTLVAAPGARVGTEELLAATVKNNDGTPAVNQVVRYRITGADSASGSVVTNGKGVGLFGYLPKHSGKIHVTAYDDVNANVAQDAGEPHGTLNVSIAKVTEHPTIHLTSRSGTVTVHVTSHPKLSHAKVTYYVKHKGNFTKIGVGRTGHRGHASQTFVEGMGHRYTFRAKVTGKSGVATGVSKSKSIKVKK
ncbi:MAG TPA: Ig-like domain-containing protein [Mycobacteriales bacterium]|nr:Ig-like domain-containing protein [Mycobacteriales bacterium]